MPLMTVGPWRATTARPSPPTTDLPLDGDEEDGAPSGGRGVKPLGGRRWTVRRGLLLLQCPTCDLQVVLTERARRLIDEDRLCCPSLDCRRRFRRAW